ncbi:conserved hypothetical protein [Altererythrobacter sp. B11]|uniref:DUF3857 domain-containing protein n=1 Tax=Altererythrobacter sp. B11 TaxID=2060312 RepID=UPI000DC700C5|nr:DUF3857 domain-containing protein [Altererythrobacter sp. B11]BBC72405.1 conserved hypothetical protein [Altererythrobacter sp. B11]
MRRFAGLLAGSMLAWSAAALAGDEPIYAPAPDWVVPAALPADLTGPPILLFDDQRLIEEGRLSSFIDRAVRVDNPQMLQALGTVQAAWLPDKGDLIIHRIALIRDGKEIDVLAQGARFDVLRRETQLEQRTIDGSLTATLAVPGMRVGDVLRLSYTTTSSDQALDKEVQTVALLPAAPFQAKQARLRMAWPKDADVAWRITDGTTLPEETVEDGRKVISVELPLPKPEEMPADSPLRYRMPALLQAGTFASWDEVSQVMAPHYATSGVEPGSPLAQQVALIAKNHQGELERAVAALRLVQDEVSYLANGMNGGNYIPQSPTETWERRYGDCKAKTMMLLAMLRELGIEAEAATVASETGDSLPELAPMPADFDHVIVRAVIEGKEYWLDGTNSGASMATVDTVPPFHFALPLRPEGAALVKMEARAPKAYDLLSEVTFDNRAGIDVPLLYDARFTLTGPAAGAIRGIIGQASKEQMDEYLDSFAQEQLGESAVLTSSASFDQAANSATVHVTGLMNSPWEWERGRASRDFSLPTAGFEFAPDRSRGAWRDIPVVVAGPWAALTRVTVLLPEEKQPFAIEGGSTIDEEIAAVRLHRVARLDGSKLTIEDSAAYPGGELDAQTAKAERARAARFTAADMKLQAPREARRRYDEAGNRKRFAPIEAAYTKLIEDDPKDASQLFARASFRAGTLDRKGALADMDAAIALEPSAAAYLQRSRMRMDDGQLEAALEDAEAAWELYPSLEAAFARANVLPYLGRTDEALQLLEEQTGDAGERRGLAMAISDLEALAGRKEEGLQRIQQMLDERPGDPEMLNARCWYQASWNVMPEDLAQVCTEAVEKADWSPPVLDSRAMGYFRLGRYEDALKDLDAALSASPDLTPSLFMRGVVRRAMGDAGGQADIRAALTRNPSLERSYARFGITVDD